MAGNFQEYFDLRRLTPRQMAEIQFVLTSPAYEDSFKPFITDILRSLHNLWKDRSRERQDNYSDDMIAGGTLFGETLVEFFEKLIQEANLETIHEAMSHMTGDAVYDLKREQGLVRPVIGLDQQVLPDRVDPNEDY